MKLLTVTSEVAIKRLRYRDLQHSFQEIKIKLLKLDWKWASDDEDDEEGREKGEEKEWRRWRRRGLPVWSCLSQGSEVREDQLNQHIEMITNRDQMQQNDK